MQSPEKVLVDRLRNKDPHAFAKVFEDYYQRLHSYAQRFLDTSEDAEEAIQEVFVKFWEKCEDLAPDSSIKSYLYRSVHNTCLNTLKHQKVKDSYRQYVIHYLEHSQEMHTEQLPNDEVSKRIYSAIDDLPARCSEIFKLSRYEGLKYQEIADHLGISIKTVEVQMGKALRTLRENLKDLK
ncbi:RNA polymerase sigma-70 factor [Marinoscillum furvescens]|uniref:RNA polymerase sigma-70 factor n=1 Tax=Marinoscillum furvescens TaxID=1026 RepID=UPI0014763B7F|nr:RNA polymerase sigma-70 factor [Marinoscillum furvescens]